MASVPSDNSVGVDAGVDSMPDDFLVREEDDVQMNSVGIDAEVGSEDGDEGNVYIFDVSCSVTVHPEMFTHTDVFPSSLGISALRRSLATSFKTSEDRVQITVQGLGDEYSDEDAVLGLTLGDITFILRDAGVETAGEPTNPIMLDMSTLDNVILDEQVELENTAPVDVIRVLVRNNEGEAVIFVRIIKEYLNRPKPFLGGWRNKKTGKTFHHAATQTKKKNKNTSVLKYHRCTQTVKTSSKSLQSKREGSTQTFDDTPDIGRVDYVASDREMEAKKYITADEVLLKRDHYAGQIQGYLRACFAQRRIRRLRQEQTQQEAVELQKQRTEEEERKKNLVKETYRRMHPMTQQDFAVLSDELAAWKKFQLEKIKQSGLSEQEQQHLALQVLGKEMAVTQITERLRQEAALKKKDALVNNRLAKMCGGHAWKGNDGVVLVDTPHTVYARELVTVYKGLQALEVTTAERIDILTAVKGLVDNMQNNNNNKHPPLIKEIKQLCEREEDLLHRGRSKESLIGLRKRIAQLFLTFINTPEYNPQAAMFKVE